MTEPITTGASSGDLGDRPDWTLAMREDDNLCWVVSEDNACVLDVEHDGLHGWDRRFLSVDQQRDLMAKVLDTAETHLRMGRMEACAKVIFIWSQRREHLLAGEETWEEQGA